MRNPKIFSPAIYCATCLAVAGTATPDPAPVIPAKLAPAQLAPAQLAPVQSWGALGAGIHTSSFEIPCSIPVLSMVEGFDIHLLALHQSPAVRP